MKKLLYFVNKWPCKNSSTPENSFFSVMSSFQNKDYHPVIISESPPDPAKLHDVEEYTVETVSIKPNDMLRLPYQLENIQLALYDSPETSRRFSYDVYNKYNKIPQLMLLKNIKTLTEYSRSQSLKTTNLVNKGTKMWPQNLSISQQESIIRSDVTIAMSQFLYHHLKPKYQNIVYGCEYLPTSAFIEQIEAFQFRPFNRRKHFYFIGNLSVQHNKDCLENLLQIWDLVKQEFPTEELHIYSKYYSPEFYQRKRELAGRRVILENEIEEIQHISKYRMLLAPFRYHVDAPGKILQAWFYHTPVVTTPFGSQSMFQELTEMSLAKVQGRFLNQKVELTEKDQYMQSQIRGYYQNNIIGDDNYDLTFGGLWKNYTNQEFAQSIITLSKDQKLWNKCMKVGQQTVIANHSDEIHFRRVVGSIANAEYKRVVNSQNTLKKDVWDAYFNAFAKDRKAKKKGRGN